MAEDDVVNMDPEKGALEPLTGKGQSETVTPAQVKFTSAPGEAVTVVSGYTGQGLSKSEVMQYASDPTWKKIRLGSFLLFWLVWFGMLGASIAIVANAGECAKKTGTSTESPSTA